MGKHKKTRREKKIADNRHTLYHLETTTVQEKITVEEKVNISTDKTYQNPTKQVVSLSYVTNDIKKITFISSILIMTQIALYIIINRV